MARIRNGILGGYRGKLGNTIGQVYRGIEVVRSLPQLVTNPQTTEQVAHRQTFSELARILSGAVNCLQFSRLSREFQYNAFNEVFRSNWRQAVSNNTIDFQKLNFGSFWGAPLDDLEVEIVSGAGDYEKYLLVELSWEGYNNDIDAFADDQVMLVCVAKPLNGTPFVFYSEFLEDTRGQTGGKTGASYPVIDKGVLSSGDIVHVYCGINGNNKPRGKGNPKEVINIPARYPAPAPPGYGANQQGTAPSGCNTLAWCYSYELQ